MKLGITKLTSWSQMDSYLSIAQKIILQFLRFFETTDSLKMNRLTIYCKNKL